MHLKFWIKKICQSAIYFRNRWKYCAVSNIKKYLCCAVFVTKGILTMYVTKVLIITYNVFIVFNSCCLEARLFWVINDQFWMKLDWPPCKITNFHRREAIFRSIPFKIYFLATFVFFTFSRNHVLNHFCADLNSLFF